MRRDDRRPDPELDVPGEPARVPGGFAVQPARTATPGGSVALLAGVALAAVVLALAVAGVLSPAPVPSPPPAAPGSTSPDRSTAAASATLPVRDVRSGDEAVAELARLAGWTKCPIWREFGTDAPVTRRDVEAAAAATGIEAGPVDVTDVDGHVQRVWLGGDAAAAVRGLGGTVIVRDADTVWTVIVEAERAVAVRLQAGVRRDGGTFWQIRGRAEPAPYCVVPVPVDGPATVVHVADRARARLFEEAGWASCKAWQRTGATLPPPLDRIDRAATLAGLDAPESGWAFVSADDGYGTPAVRTWLGTDDEEAALAHGSSLMVVEDGPIGTAWLRVKLGGREIAVQFWIIETPEGRTAWLATPNAAGVMRGCETVP